MAKMKKKQAEELLAEYTKQQTAATQAAIAANNAQLDASVAAKETEAAQQLQKANEKAKAAYDKQLIEQIADKRRTQRALAGWGLSWSGAEHTMRAAENETARRAQQAIATERATAHQDIHDTLSAARAKAAADKKQKEAAARKTLATKIADKRLSLMRNAR